MDEKPESIWKKPLRLPQLLLAWLGLMMATMFIFLAVKIIINEPFEISWLMIFGAAGATVLLAGWVLIRWLCCWRNFKRALFALACFATLIALFYAEENWRGKRAWENYKHEWEAKGEHFDFASVVPPPVPDEQNFAMAPVVATCYESILDKNGHKLTKWNTNVVNRLAFEIGDGNLNTNVTGYWANGTLSNLKVLQEHYRELAAKTNLFAVPPQPQSPAADVLLALGKYDATVEELRQAGELPYCRFPLNYDTENCAEILLPQLATMKGSSRLLQLRALAELQNGQSEKALADVRLTLRLTEAIRTEPFLISHLVRIAMTEITLQPIYEGLANHQWTDGQLVALDAELARLDFLADYNFTMRGERVFSTSIIDYVSKGSRNQKYQEMTGMMFDNQSTTTEKEVQKIALGVGFWLMPAGWFEQNKLAVAKFHEQWLLWVAEPENHLALPQIANKISPLLDQWKSGPCNIFVKLFLPSLPHCITKFAREQISVDLARTAIALERYRLAHGKFPESLDALTPQFIAKVPHDVIGGQPLKYRREAKDRFVLYSVGWNERDDGGVTFIPKNGSQPRFEEGDWVWRYPAK